MQNPAANTAPGRCDDDEVGDNEGGIDRSRAVFTIDHPTTFLCDLPANARPHANPLVLNHGDNR
jgi:hypothetical protein